MDFIYDDGPKDLSLQSLTTTIVIQKILEDEGMLPNCEINQRTIASRAIEVVNNLPLPLPLKWQLRPMVLPIMKEMNIWYLFKQAPRVVLTQNGMVDVQKSIRDMLNNENVSLMQRFKVACEHCLEQEIFDIGAQINFPRNFSRDGCYPIWNYFSLDRIWYTIYERNFHAKLGRKDISEVYCTQGFVHAFYNNNLAGVKYFVEGAAPSEISRYIHSDMHSMFSSRSFTPNMLVKIFKRFNENERQQYKSSFSGALLKALLTLPYQQQFLKAAESLVLNLDSDDFWSLQARIVRKARDGWEDHDYKGLFIDFWKLSNESKISYTVHVDSYFYVRDLLYNVILMQDERLAHFVLDNTNEEFKTKHLFNFCDGVCLRLISEKRFEALELFMKVCRVNNDKFTVKFHKDILEYLDHGVSCCDSSLTSIKRLNEDELKNILLEFLSRMDKMKPPMS